MSSKSIQNQNITSGATASKSNTHQNKPTAAASFKKLQPEEFYRQHIDKVSARGKTLFHIQITIL